VKNKAHGKTIELARSITFEAAHYLTAVPKGHKCAGLHGHSYRVRVYLSGEVQDDGFVVDNGEIDGFLREIRRRLDHTCFNDEGIEGLSENPTAENLCAWIYDQVPGHLRDVFDRVEIEEGPDSIFTMHKCGWA